MNSEAWQPGARVRVKSTNQEGVVVGGDAGQSTRVQFTPDPDAPAESVTTVIANADLEAVSNDAAARRREFAAGESASVIPKLEASSPNVRPEDERRA